MEDKTYRLSLTERDRRYKLVREAMQERGLDALLIWGDGRECDWHMANVHYLSQVGGNSEEAFLIFPLEGEPSIIIWSYSIYQTKCWIEYGSWIKLSEFRGRQDGLWSKPVAQRLKELKLDTATIGVTGLLETDSIQVPYCVYTALREELPNTNFQNASGLLENIRAIKSPEEITLMEKSALIGEAAIDTIAEVARPGISEHEVIAAMTNTILMQGADIPVFILFDSGMVKTGGGRLGFTKHRILQHKDILFTEFSPRVHGYCCHLNQTLVVGDWPDGLEKAYEAWLASYRAGYDAIRPGITVGDLQQAFREPLAPTGFKYAEPAPDGWRYGAIAFHGTGYGNEGFGGSRGMMDPTVVLREGMTLAIECGASLPDNSMGVRMGDTVLVTADGRRRLGTKEPAIKIC